MTLYTIRNWKAIFENNRSREIKNPSWVAQPNSHDGFGFRTLIAKPNGAALYGVWCVLVQIASKCNPRGSLVRDSGEPHTAQSISIKTGLLESDIEACFSVICSPEIGWMVATEFRRQRAIPQEGAAIPQEGAAIPQEGAAIPQEGAAIPQAPASVARARGTNERTNEGTTTAYAVVLTDQGSTTTANGSPTPKNNQTEFPKTVTAVCTRFPTADRTLVLRIVEAAAKAYLSVDAPKILEPDDAVYADAVECAAMQAKKQNSAALFLRTVPNVIGNWAKNGRTQGNQKLAGMSPAMQRHAKELGFK